MYVDDVLYLKGYDSVDSHCPISPFVWPLGQGMLSEAVCINMHGPTTSTHTLLA